MTEPEMVAYMMLRGATKNCIFYAQRKFREASVKGKHATDTLFFNVPIDDFSVAHRFDN